MRMAVLRFLPGMAMTSGFLGRMRWPEVAENDPYLPFRGTECDLEHVGLVGRNAYITSTSATAWLG